MENSFYFQLVCIKFMKLTPKPWMNECIPRDYFYIKQKKRYEKKNPIITPEIVGVQQKTPRDKRFLMTLIKYCIFFVVYCTFSSLKAGIKKKQ